MFDCWRWQWSTAWCLPFSMHASSNHYCPNRGMILHWRLHSTIQCSSSIEHGTTLDSSDSDHCSEYRHWVLHLPDVIVWCVLKWDHLQLYSQFVRCSIGRLYIGVSICQQIKFSSCPVILLCSWLANPMHLFVLTHCHHYETITAHLLCSTACQLSMFVWSW